MREMKDSGVEWIGEIPRGWGLGRAKATFRQRREKGNSEGILLAATQKNGMYPQDLVEGVVQVKEETDLQTFNSVHINDFVISLRSFQGGFEISSFEGVCSPAYQVFYNIVPIAHGYYKYLFKADAFISKINSITVGIREGKNIQYSDFSDLLLPTLDINEQHRIADYLDAKCAQIDRAIARQQEVIETLKEYKLSVITEAVTKGMNPDVPMKDSGIEWIGEIPGHWETIKLKFLLSQIIDCPHETPNYNPEGEYYVIRTADQDFGYLRSTDDMYRLDKEEYVNRTRRLSLDENDIVYGREGERWGLACLVPETARYCLGQRMMQFRCDTAKFLPFFAMWALNSKNVYLQGMVDTFGSTSPHVNISTIRNYTILLPELYEQKQIAEYLCDFSMKLELSIKTKQALIEKLIEYKKSLIYEVVTGKREV